MSTWIFDRNSVKTIIGLSLLTALVACGSSRFTPRASHPDTKSTISVASRNVVIEGPSGFCVDRETSQVGGETAFVLLGNCSVISPRSRAPDPDVKALLTASIAGPRPGVGTIADSVETLDRFFRSDSGRTALSRDSDPASVDVLETFQKDNSFFLRASDTSESIVPGASQDYWRTYFDLNGQIVALSVIGFDSDPIAPETGLQTLQEFSDLIRANNGGEPTQPVTTVAAVQPVAPKKTSNRTFWTLGLLRRILN